MQTIRLSLLTACLFAACGDGKSPAGTHTHADGTVHADHPAEQPAGQPGEHAHSQHTDLGSGDLIGHQVKVWQLSPLTAGGELEVDVEFGGTKALPATVRAWFGVESGEGSMKCLLGKDGERTLHGHAEVPKPLPASGKLWVEIDEGGSRSRIGVTPQ